MSNSRRRASNRSERRTSTARVSAQRNPSQVSIENGIKILQTAIKRRISLSEASRTHKKGRNYLSDVKARVSDNLKKKNISREQYSNFNNLVKQYSKVEVK